MKKIYRKILFCFVSLVLLSCSNTDKQEKSNSNSVSGSISISGAFALYPLTVKWAEEFKKTNPDINIDISAGGAGKGMVDVLSDMVDIAMFSRDLKQEEIAKGAWVVAVAKDAVVAAVHEDNAEKENILTKGLNCRQLTEIFIEKKYKTWGEIYGTNNKSAINVFTRSDASGAGEMWGKYLKASQESIKGIQVFGDPGVANAVKSDKNSIGYNNIGFAYDINTRKCNKGMMIVPIDLNDNGKIDDTENFYNCLDSLNSAIKKGIYPQPPARNLYFITKGKPKNKIVILFIQWILTDGQQYIDKAGYVKLNDEIVKEELKKL